MLVLSRLVGESVIVGSAGGHVVVTVTALLPTPPAAAIRWEHRSLARGPSDPARSATIEQGRSVEVGSSITIELVAVRPDKVHLGINAPIGTVIHRLEVYEALTRGRDRPDEGPAGAAFPRPPKPTPPTLDVRMDEPPPADPAGA